MPGAARDARMLRYDHEQTHPVPLFQRNPAADAALAHRCIESKRSVVYVYISVKRN
jgi:hypothetical protein